MRWLCCLLLVTACLPRVPKQRLAERARIAVGYIVDPSYSGKAFEPPDELKKRFAAKSIEGMTIPAAGMNADIHASPEYRAHLVGVLAKRALNKANA